MPRTGRRPADGALVHDAGRLALWGVGGLGIGTSVAFATLGVDRWLDLELPVAISNVQLLVGTLVGAVVTLAVFALWMRTVVVGLVSSQVSARVATAYLEDTFQHRLMGFAVTVVSYLATVVIVLPSGGQLGPPAISTVLSVVLTLAALASVLLAIRAAITSLALPDVIRRLADNALEIMDRLPRPNDPPPDAHLGADVRADVGAEVVVDTMGWITEIDHDALLEVIPEGSTLTLRADVGRFVGNGDLVAHVDAPIGDEEHEQIRQAITIARTRASDRDLAFAIQHLVDIAEHAMSPHSKDTSTAHEALEHLRAVLAALLHRGTASGWLRGERGRWVHSIDVMDPADHLAIALDPLRVGATTPSTTRALLATIDDLRRTAQHVSDPQSRTVLDGQRRSLLAEGGAGPEQAGATF